MPIRIPGEYDLIAGDLAVVLGLPDSEVSVSDAVDAGTDWKLTVTMYLPKLPLD